MRKFPAARIIGLLLISLSSASPASAQLPEGFVEVRDVIPTIVLDIRLYGTHNFIGRRINGYRAPKSYLTEKAALALKAVQGELLTMGLSLKIYDSYRPHRAVDHFVEWAEDLSDTAMKAEFYPAVEKRYLFRDGYISARSGHSRGSTLDLTIITLPVEEEGSWFPETLVDCTLPAKDRFADNSLDMGTGYDCFDTLSWTEDERIAAQQRANRLLLRALMERHGFRNYPREWWHYSLIDEPFPDTYFDFPVE